MAGVIEVPVTSNEYIRVQVNATLDGVDTNISADFAEFAFLPLTDETDPDVGEWVAGSMEVGLIHTYARVLVGPAGHPLAIGRYRVWCRVTDNPERPVRFVGVLNIV